MIPSISVPRSSSIASEYDASGAWVVGAFAVGVLVVRLRQQPDQAGTRACRRPDTAASTLSPNACLRRCESALVVGAGVVELGDHHGARHADLSALQPQRLGRVVDTLVGGDHEQRAVRGPQPGPQLADEVGVAGRVDQVDLDPVVLERREREADRSLLRDLRLVAVAHRGAVDDGALSGEYPGGDQQGLDECGLAATRWAHQHHIADGGRTVRGGGGSGAWEVVVLSAMTVPSRRQSRQFDPAATLLSVNPQFPEPTPSTRDSMSFAGVLRWDACRPSGGALLALLGAVAMAAVLSSCGESSTTSDAQASSTTRQTSRSRRSMIPHHQQALEMAAMVPRAHLPTTELHRHGQTHCAGSAGTDRHVGSELLQHGAMSGCHGSHGTRRDGRRHDVDGSATDGQAARAEGRPSCDDGVAEIDDRRSHLNRYRRDGASSTNLRTASNPTAVAMAKRHRRLGSTGRSASNRIRPCWAQRSTDLATTRRVIDSTVGSA